MEYKSEWSRRLVACSKGEDTMLVGDTDELVRFIETTVAERNELQAAVDKYKRNVESVITFIGSEDVIVVREGGGFDDILATLAVSISKIVTDLSNLRKEISASRYPWNPKPQNAFDLLKKGGSWLGRVREFLQRKAIGGENLIWGGHEWVTLRSVTVSDMEYLAADIALAAQKEFFQDRERERRFAETIDNIKTGKVKV